MCTHMLHNYFMPMPSLFCLYLILLLLRISGDIEINPGPTYAIDKCVQGSYHQGDQRFGETAGTQCACNSLFALLWSKVKQVYTWNRTDLDKILVEGDLLYKSLNTLDLLSVDDLPRTVQVSGNEIAVEFLHLETNIASLREMDPFLRSIVPVNTEVSFLLFMGSNTTALVTYGSSVYLFDSHSRDERGLTVADGTSVLLKFKNLLEVEKYMQVTYLEYRDIQRMYFQLQFVCINFDNIVRTNIILTVRNERRCNKRKLTSRKDLRKTEYSKVLINDKVNAFKEQVKEGPCFICVSCNRSLYKRSVVSFKFESYDLIDNVEVFSLVRSYTGDYYICKTCHKKLKKGKIPCQSVYNKLDIFKLPRQFTDIRRLEQVLVSRRILFKKVTIMPKGNSPKLKGTICNIPIEMVDVNCNSLPRPADSNGLIIVKLKRKVEYRGHVLFEPVRPEFVKQFLYFLKKHNKLYEDININMESIPQELLALENEVSKDTVFSHLISAVSEPIEIVIESCKDKDIASGDEHKSMEVFEDSDSSEKAFIFSKLLEKICEPIAILREGDESTEQLEEVEDPLAKFRTSLSETTLTTEIPGCDSSNEYISIAPGEGKRPVSILNDEYCEELAHPHLFPTGKFGYKAKRNIYLTPSKYFNQRLLNYSQIFASDSDYIFFVHSVLQKIQLSNQINIAMQKIASNSVTAGMLSRNFKQTVRDCVAQDRAYSFMNTVKGTPAYWKKFMQEVLAMVKQLGIPTFFLTLSCADLRWNELISIISKINNLNLSDEDICHMTYNERCDVLNKNPVLVARHFQYRVEIFFKVIILDGPLGKTQYYAIRVEFQVRGSPHIHSFIWILNAPKLTKLTLKEYKQWLDNIVRADLPNSLEEPELYNLVKMYQIHHHSKTCRKYRNEKCRFHFGKFFTDHTIIAEPIPDNISDEEKNNLLEGRNKILRKVKHYIDTELNPSKKNFLDATKPDYEELRSIEEILNMLDISKTDYENALSISEDSSYKIHLKRMPNSCFVNNYFKEGLMAWEANLDIQPVFDKYKAIAYMCAYLSKSEDECTNAMKDAMKDALQNKSDKYEQMKSIANAYINKRECSVQECVYHILSGQWLRKTYPGVVFANSNIPQKRFRMCLTEKEVSELPEDSTNIFKRNMIDRYRDRPNKVFNGGKYAVLDEMCYAEFLRYYYLQSSKCEDNDYQPIELTDDLIEANNSTAVCYPKVVPLMSSKEKLKCRQTACVLQYHIPNKETHPEEYAHHLLFMYFPFRDEQELLSGSPPSYQSKASIPDVAVVINRNRALVEPLANDVDIALEQYNRFDVDLDPYGQQENDEMEEEMINEGCSNATGDPCEPNSSSADFGFRQPEILPDDTINANIRSLNKKQREVFNVTLKWTRDHVKNLSSKNSTKILPFHIFLTGGAGVGKSHVLKTIYMSATKVLGRKGGDPGKPRVLVLAPTGVAAINVDGTTIHCGLGINVGHKMYPLNDKQRASLRNKLSEVKLLIIDEVSMVSSALFYQVNQRLNEIFMCSSDKCFGGLSVLLCGDFYQLPPVRGIPLFSSSDAIKSLLSLNLWRKFEMVELTEVMRQRGDERLIELLNKVRIGIVDEIVEKDLLLRFIEKDSPSYPDQGLHIFAENSPVGKHNLERLEMNNNQLVCVTAIDKIPKECNITENKLQEIRGRKLSETGNLPFLLKLKVGASVMLTVNVDIQDRLVNGLVGKVEEFKFVNNKVEVVYVSFDDVISGRLAMFSDAVALQHNWVPIKKIETSFGIAKNKVQPSIKRTQFPLTLSWACTVHKVQGLSLNKAIISFDLERQKCFNQGQMYVALSRITNMENMYLIGKYSRSAIKENKSAKIEYERLRQESVMKSLPLISPSECSLTITLLNIRSLRRHAIDIKSDEQLLKNDIICLTEILIPPGGDLNDVNNELQDYFSIDYNLSHDQHRSIAFCSVNEISILAHQKYDGLSLITIIKPSFSIHRVKVMLLYRSPSSSQSVFYRRFAALLQSNQVDILLGDFNIDALDDAAAHQLNDILGNFQLIVKEPTHLDGGLLDHIYLHKLFLVGKHVDSIVSSIYFSDHDAVKVKVSNIY